MIDHPTEETLLFYRFGTLDPETSGQLAEHLRTCSECTRRYAALGDAVGKLETYDVESSADPEALAYALSRATSALQAKAERGGPASGTVTPAGQAPPGDEPARRAAPSGAEHPSPPPLRPRMRPEPEEEAPPAPFHLLEWLGLEPGAGFRPLRLATGALIACGLLYLGGGQAYYATRSHPLDTEVSGDVKVVAGGRSLFRVKVLREGQPVAGAAVTAQLVSGAGKQGVFSGQTGPDGEALVSVLFPYADDPSPMLQLEVHAGREVDRVSRVLELKREYKLHLSSDKPLYQPGQTIHLRALAMNEPRPVPAAGKQVTFEVRDARDVQIVKQTVPVSAYGVASYALELSDDIALGTWKVRASLGDTSADAQVEVARYTLPKFKLSLAPTKETFLAGERFKAHLSARYFFGKPVERAEVRALLLQQNGAVLADVKGKTDAHGGFDVEAELPAGLAAEGRPEPIIVQLEAKDAAGQEERTQRAVTVARELLSVDLLPDGEAQQGVPNTFFVVTTTPDGAPVSADVEVALPDGTSAKVRTGQTGIGRFDFTPPPGRLTFGAKAEDVQGRRASRELELPLHPATARVTPEKVFYRPGEAVNVTVRAPEASGRYRVEARAEGRLVQRTTVQLTQGVGEGSLTLPADVVGTLALSCRPELVGLARLLQDGPPRETARRVAMEQPRPRGGDAPGPSSERRIVVAEPSGLKVKLTGDKPAWRPGEEAKLRFEVSGPDGKPTAAALGISVVDESLFALSSGKPALVRAYFVVEQALLGAHYGTSAGELVGGGAWSDEVQTAGRLLLSLDAPTAAPALPRFEESTLANKLARLQVEQSEFSQRSELVGWLLGVLAAIVLLLTAASRLSPGLMGFALVGAMLLAAAFGAPWLLAGGAGVVLGFAAAALGYHRTRRVPLAVLGLPLLAAFVLMAFTTLSQRSPPDALAGPDRLYEMKGAIDRPAPRLAMKAEPAAPAEMAAGVGANLAAVEGGAAPGKPPEPPHREVRVRQHFPETLYVNPQLVTDDKGVAELTLPLADSITSWRLTALASSSDGQLGALDAPLEVFQDFFVDLDTPVALVRGDEATVPIAVYNYLQVPQRVRLEVEAQSWFEVVGKPQLTAELQPGAVEGLSLRIRVLEPGTHALKVRADGTQTSDVVARQLLVSEAGREASATVSGMLTAGQTNTVALQVPPAATGALQLSLKLFPSSASTALDGIEGTLREPTGCFEQTSSSTYPNLLVLEYLRREHKATPALEAQAQRYLSLGYQRLVGFEVQGGGFEWFGRAPANQLLTAYGLMEFTDMSRVYPVDPQLVARTQRFLAGRQQDDGAWAPDPQMISDGLFRSEHTGRLTMTAYVTWALTESGDKGPGVERAQDFLSRNLEEMDDAYTLALATAGFARTHHASADKAAQALVAKAHHDKALVSFRPSGATAYYGRGEAAEVETTALAAYALSLAGRESELVKGARDFVLAHREANGAWPSTQATILALKALLTGFEPKSPPKVTVRANGAEVGTFTLSDPQAKVLLLDEKAKKGANVLELTSDADAPFLATASYTLPWRSKGDDEKAPLSLKVDYQAKRVEVGGIVPVDVKLTYRGTEPSGMALIELGVPAGLTPVADDLEQARLRGAVGKYQLSAGKVFLYLDRVGPGATVKLALRFKAHTPVDTAGVGSRAYLYYDPSVRASAPPVAVAVR